MKKFAIIFFSILFFSACNPEPKVTALESTEVTQTVELTAEQLKQAGVEVSTLQTKVISYSLKVNGKIEAPPQNYISISAPMGGFLRSTDLLPGMKVKKGDVLALMEDQQYIQLQEQFLQTKSALQQTEKEYNRQKSLNQDKSTSDKMLEQATANYQSQKTAYAALREKLRLIGVNPEQLSDENLSRQIAIISPITGYVAKVNANIGKYISASDVVFELVNPDDIHLALTVFEKDIERLAVGQKVIASTNHSQKIYHCDIILLGRNIGADRSIDVHCHFLEYDHSLLPGMYMNAVIECGSTEVPAIVDAAIVDFEGKACVFVQESVGKYHLVEVQKGPSENGFTAITAAEDLNNKKIVSSGAYSLLMKLKNTAEEE